MTDLARCRPSTSGHRRVPWSSHRRSRAKGAGKRASEGSVSEDWSPVRAPRGLNWTQRRPSACRRCRCANRMSSLPWKYPVRPGRAPGRWLLCSCSRDPERTSTTPCSAPAACRRSVRKLAAQAVTTNASWMACSSAAASATAAALLTRKTGRPTATRRSTSRSRPSARPRSACIPWMPGESSPDGTRAVRATAMTSQPARPSACAAPRPIPRLPPVMHTTGLKGPLWL